MAFNPTYLQLWSAPIPLANKNIASPVNPIPQLYGYNAQTDSIATVSASGYFNFLGNPANNPPSLLSKPFRLGDQIWCQCSNGGVLLFVSGLNPTVTSVVNNSFVSVAVTAAQLNGAFAAPVQMIAAPGAGKYIRVKDWTIDFTFGAAQFANGGATALQYDSTINGAGTLATASVAAATINGFAVNSITGVAGLVAAAASSTVVNKGIFLSNLAAAFITGTGCTMNMQISYNVFNF